jgi:hypothetical protein
MAEWLNQNVMEYFFAKVSMDSQRKAFWSRYAPKMSKIRIAMHTGNSSSYRYFDDEDVNNWIRNRHIRVERFTADIALIMEYGEWVIVEIGAIGNACYIYRRLNPLIGNLGTSIKNFNDLKQPHLSRLNAFSHEGEGKIIHNEGWQDTMRTILHRKMQLVP